jgi:hypothetical protein
MVRRAMGELDIEFGMELLLVLVLCVWSSVVAVLEPFA